MGATITVIGSGWISLDNSLPEVQKPCYFWIERTFSWGNG